MKKLILLLLFLLPTWVIAAYTEFYCQTTASNLNAGSTTSDTAAQTYAGGTFVRSTGVFTVASGNPSSDGVSVGDFASIYTTAGATVATFVARVTARDTTTITVSLTAIAGAAATVSETAAAATCKVGGAWDGPSGATIFPFNFIASTLTNSGGDYPRVNIKNGVTYTVSATLNHTLAGPTTFQGYTSSAGDGGRATLDGGADAISVITANADNITYTDLICGNGTGGGGVININGTENIFFRCVAHTGARQGFNIAGSAKLTECEAYNNNSENNSSGGGFFVQAVATLTRCISHDNINSNGVGFRVSAYAVLNRCIADSNAGKGLYYDATTTLVISNSDFYNNTGDGIDLAGASATLFFIENSNFLLNGGYGINSSGSSVRNGYILNCGFGAGTQANASGNIATAAAAIPVIGTVNYASNVTPWTAPSTGNFSINLAAAKAAGRGSFTETASSYTGTVGYPDIGAAQSSSVAGGGQKSYSF